MNKTKPRKDQPVEEPITGSRDRTKGAPTPKRPRQGSGVTSSGATRAGQPQGSVSPAPVAATAYAPSRKRRAVHVGATAGAATLHGLSVAFIAPVLGDPLFILAYLMLPAWITIWLLPGARTTGYHRWLTVTALANVTVALWSIPVLIVGHAWVLHRFWCVEFPGTAAPTGPIGTALGRITDARKTPSET